MKAQTLAVKLNGYLFLDLSEEEKLLINTFFCQELKQSTTKNIHWCGYF